MLGRKGSYGVEGREKGGLRLCQQGMLQALRIVDSEDCGSPVEEEIHADSVTSDQNAFSYETLLMHTMYEARRDSPLVSLNSLLPLLRITHGVSALTATRCTA